MARIRRHTRRRAPRARRDRTMMNPYSQTMSRLTQHQMMMEELRARRARQEQERGAAIAAAVAAAMANFEPPEPRFTENPHANPGQQSSIWPQGPTMEQVNRPYWPTRVQVIVEGCMITDTDLNYHIQPEGTFRTEKAPMEAAHEGTFNCQREKRPMIQKRSRRRSKRGGASLQCEQCGRNHGTRPCLVGLDVCYACGRAGHFSRECPDRANSTRPSTQDDVITLVQPEQEQTPKPPDTT